MKIAFVNLALLPLAVAAAGTTDLPTLVPPYGELPPSFWELHRTAIVIGGCVLILLIPVVIWLLARPKPATHLPPEQIARAALEQLRLESEDGKLLSEVSQILRRYTGAVFQFAGSEMTTAEFCASLSGNPKIGTELSGTLASFLQECDVRKFSPASATAPMNAVNRALELVAQVETAIHRQDACAPAP